MDVIEAEAMARAATELGVPRRDIIVEGTARNTQESARAVKRVLKSKRIFLVTSAYHMKRAEGLFKKQGFDVFPRPPGTGPNSGGFHSTLSSPARATCFILPAPWRNISALHGIR
jgi:uncharacterized SAM-binding protein YcdF (DUF218 family)